MNIEKIIQTIRDSFIGAEHIYQNGSCWHFANILKHIYPKGDIVCNFDHCLFKLDDKLYDIEGERNPQIYKELEICNKLPKTEKMDLFHMVQAFRK